MERFHPDRILIEPSGVGKLSDVMKSVIDLEKERDVKLNALVTVVNAMKASKQMKAFGEFFNNQIEFATTIVLSRTQNVTQEKLELCVKQMQALNEKAAIITTPWDEISGASVLKVIEQNDSMEMELLAEARHAKESAEHAHHHHDKEHGHDEHGHCECHGHEECGGHKSHDEQEHGHCECHGRDGHAHNGHEHDSHTHEHHVHSHDEHDEHGHDEHGHEHGHDEHGHCECHTHEHEECHGHGHHHADEIFTSWGKETPHKYDRAVIEHALKVLSETEDYGTVLRAKGMVEAADGTWIYFDMVPGEYELREGQPEYTGRLCVIGCNLAQDRLLELFELV